jgi:hypothetical protein
METAQTFPKTEPQRPKTAEPFPAAEWYDRYVIPEPIGDRQIAPDYAYPFRSAADRFEDDTVRLFGSQLSVVFQVSSPAGPA